jgi:hypothetical protein
LRREGDFVSIQILGTDGNNITSRDVDASPDNFVYVNGKLTFSGSYPTGGDTLDFTTIADKILSDQCIAVAVSSQAIGNAYLAIGGITTALNGWKVVCQTPGSLTQLAAGTYPSQITSDTVTFTACFRKLL